MATPLIPWPGGKRRLAKTLLQQFPEHTCYVEAFAGAAALYMLKEPSQVEVINDVNGELINLYRVVQCHLEELVRQFKWALSSRQVFRWLQETRPETLTDIQRAARFMYLQKTTFGAKVQGQSYGTGTTRSHSINLLRLEEHLSEVHLRLQGAYIEHLPWQDCLKRYDRAHTFFYLDPPYWQTEGYGIHFAWAQYEEIRQAMLAMKGKCILSINNHKEIVALFEGFRHDEVQIDYTMSGGHKVKKASELIIYNW